MRASVLTLAIALSGCALTLDATHLGVPVSLASSAQGPDSGTAFSVTKHSIYLLVGLVPVSQPNLEDVLAGQVGTDPATGQPAPGGVREQTRQVLQNVKAILEAAGTDLDNVIKTTCFLADIKDFGAFNEVYREFFPTDPPARSTVQVGLVPPWLVEIEAVAVRP